MCRPRVQNLRGGESPWTGGLSKIPALFLGRFPTLQHERGFRPEWPNRRPVPKVQLVQRARYQYDPAPRGIDLCHRLRGDFWSADLLGRPNGEPSDDLQDESKCHGHRLLEQAFRWTALFEHLTGSLILFLRVWCESAGSQLQWCFHQ